MAALLFGCSKKPDVTCPRPVAPFRLQLTGERGALPFDTHLSVLYQGNKNGHEDYDVVHPSMCNIDVCCRKGVPTKGPLPSVPCIRKAKCDGPPQGDAGERAEASIPSDGATSRDASPSTDGSSFDASEAGGAIEDAAMSAADGATDSGPSSNGAPEAILCELWTGGPAEITGTGSGYPPLDTGVFAAQLSECPNVFETRDLRVVWTLRDGGI